MVTAGLPLHYLLRTGFNKLALGGGNRAARWNKSDGQEASQSHAEHQEVGYFATLLLPQLANHGQGNDILRKKSKKKDAIC